MFRVLRGRRREGLRGRGREGLGGLVGVVEGPQVAKGRVRAGVPRGWDTVELMLLVCASASADFAEVKVRANRTFESRAFYWPLTPITDHTNMELGKHLLTTTFT